MHYVGLNLVNGCASVRKIPHLKVFNRRVTVKVTQGHRNCRYMYLIGHISLPISGHYSILHRFRDITILTVFVTGCDLEKSFGFDKTVEITSHVQASIEACVNYRPT